MRNHIQNGDNNQQYKINNQQLEISLHVIPPNQQKERNHCHNERDRPVVENAFPGNFDEDIIRRLIGNHRFGNRTHFKDQQVSRRHFYSCNIVKFGKESNLLCGDLLRRFIDFNNWGGNKPGFQVLIDEQNEAYRKGDNYRGSGGEWGEWRTGGFL